MASPSTLAAVRKLAAREQVRIPDHGYGELAADGPTAREVLAGVADAVLIEDYPDSPKGPCVLVLQRAAGGRPVHAVRGIPAGCEGYDVLGEAARETDSQVIAASHSEVLLNEAADRDVVVAFVGRPHRFDDRFERLGLPNRMQRSGYHDLARFAPRERADAEIVQVLDRIVAVADAAVRAAERGL